MSNKSQLQTNNTALDALITRVKAAKDVAASLPDAGSGGSGGGGVEVFNITINSLAASAGFYYLADNLTIEKATKEGTYPCLYGVCVLNNIYPMINVNDYAYNDISSNTAVIKFNCDASIVVTP